MKLGVNIDHVATLRQARGGVEPDPLRAAEVCHRAGADSIVMHLREDRRHIQDHDLFRVKKNVSIKLNLEMSIAESIVEVALRLKPHQVTLVPEKRQERTTESGLDLLKSKSRLQQLVPLFKKNKILVSLFIDPEKKQLDMASFLGVDAVEFHTGSYALAKNPSQIKKEWTRLDKAVRFARLMRITAHAGHGLDYENVGRIKKIKGLDELNIGYSIVTRALWVGLDQAVREMKKLVSK